MERKGDMERRGNMGKGSERRENMEIWKGLRGDTEGQSGDQIMKNFVPAMLRSLDLDLGKSRVTEGLPQPNSATGREL